ncbi:ANTAR domain-containing protein [Blastococcus brunescens]|uniref:histidine kinase n=1 Tax=Blastococcus brunescens TaxID=1564165 RepID=A0ABZ1B109_9ACTN|nr:ANTAR domain-containing protein [Blastococcus sp. BMG 8361]WRL64498.1 ANTAR domain-containing protein [Blastococcus sp. BMG 8361]
MASPATSRPRVPVRPPRGARPDTAVTVPRPEPGPTAGPGRPAERVAGRYRYDRRSCTWWWSREMFTLHGLPVTPEPPSTDEYLRYQRPEDRARAREALTRAWADGRAFALETHIVRADGRERTIVLVGEPRRDASGEVTAVDGICVDITEGRPATDRDRTSALEAEVEQMRAAMASRAAIEQAKGILMLLTNCGDQVAFDLLAHISSHTHRKVRDVAEVITRSAAGQTRLPDDVRAIIRDACPPSQPLR